MCNQQKGHCNAYSFRASNNGCSLTPVVVTYDVNFYLYVKDGKHGFFAMQGLKMDSKVVQRDVKRRVKIEVKKKVRRER